MDIGTKIKQRREELGLSQDELAKKMGYKSRSSINKIEKENPSLSFDKIVDFANALDIEPTFFITGDDYQKQLLEVVNKFYTLTPEELRINNLTSFFKLLNEEGQKKVMDYAHDMTLIKVYYKDNQTSID